MVLEDGRAGEGGAEQWHGLLAEHAHVIGVGLFLVAHDGVDVGEVGLDEDGLEAAHVGEAAVHEDDVDNVVADVAFAFNLKRKNDV